MNCKIEFSPLVKSDLINIKKWYNKIDKKLFSKFLKEYKSKIRFISENPNSCAVKYDNFRISFLNKFSYGIHYQYFYKTNTILIISIFHTSRNPGIWKERE